MTFFIFPILSKAQPLLNAWKLSSGTASYEFYPRPPTSTTTVTMTDSADVLQVCSTATNVYIRANRLGSYLMGPWLMNPNVPSAQDNTYLFPISPQEETGTKTSTPAAGPAALGIDGINIYGYGDTRSYSSTQGNNSSNGDGNWNADAWISEGSTMDANGNGHADGQGNYHYHANPITLYSNIATAHAPIIGFAFDGFPIYGPFGYSSAMDVTSGISRIMSSYQLRNISIRTVLPDGQTSSPAGPPDDTSFPLGTYIEDYEYDANNGDLDQYNGRMCVTPEYPSGTYAYFLTTSTNGDPAFPYVLAAEYYGVVAQNAVGPQAGNETIPTTADCSNFTNLESIRVRPNNLSIYPNPAKDQIVLELDIAARYSIQLFDALGRQVFVEKKTINSAYTMSLKNYNKGVYIVLITNVDSGLVFSTKMIKE